MPDRIEQNNPTASSPDFSINQFFHDAYDKGIVAAVADHPKEAVVTAVGAVALGAVIGKSLIKEEATLQVMGPATDELVARGIPMTAEARAAAANPEVLKMAPWHRPSAIRGAAEYMEAHVKDALNGAGLRLAPNTSALIEHALPITPINRAAASNTAFLRQAVFDRSAAIRGIESYKGSLK